MLFGIDIDKNNYTATMMEEHRKNIFKSYSYSNTIGRGNALFSMHLVLFF